ncbi:hypothetical protein ACFSM5_15465 [Lacibacterium aquatile]|uniref:Uncharacterized protein n=1 Tax=Lacibacterium aquatile TaxID=1168082 RepID=A0ABW5DWH7_9PROT
MAAIIRMDHNGDFLVLLSNHPDDEKAPIAHMSVKIAKGDPRHQKLVRTASDLSAGHSRLASDAEVEVILNKK